MPHEYTRQRQGRDFSLSEYLANAAAASRKNTEKAKKIDEDKKTLADRLEQYKTEAEQNAVPVDGHEPAPEKHPAAEKGRILI